VDIYLTQLLSGYGCFKYYMNSLKHERSPHCPLCESDKEETEHMFFVYPRFVNERRDLSIRVGRTSAACYLVDIMLESGRRSHSRGCQTPLICNKAGKRE